MIDTAIPVTPELCLTIGLQFRFRLGLSADGAVVATTPPIMSAVGAKYE